MQFLDSAPTDYQFVPYATRADGAIGYEVQVSKTRKMEAERRY